MGPAGKLRFGLRTDGLAEGFRSAGFIADGGADLDGSLGHGLDGFVDLILHALRGNFCKVLVGHDANAALVDAEEDVLAEVAVTGIPLVKEPDEGLADVLKAGGQRDGRRLRIKGQLLVGVNADEPGFAGLERSFRSAVAGKARNAPTRCRSPCR